jgi:predicted 2-oxoglutarate/Fe(II)-dependent dioxygenase YbiX
VGLTSLGYPAYRGVHTSTCLHRPGYHAGMNLRDGVLIQRDAIAAQDLRFLQDFVQRAKMQDSLVSNFADDAPEDAVEWVVKKEIRDTQELQLPDDVRARLRSIDDASIAQFIDPYFGVEVSDREPSQILHYGTGGHYIPHVDAETLYKDEDGRDFWEKTLERDLSIVYFLNDGYVGGELVFPELDLSVKPEPGTLICFPSDHNYIHGVKPVTAGRRYTIVTWLRVANTPDKDEINQEWMEEYRRQWPKAISQPPRIFKR